jgi:parallel beta-helix repeat protein
MIAAENHVDGRATVMHRFVLRRGLLFALVACLAAVGLAIPGTPASATVTGLTKCQPITAPGKYRLDADVSGTRTCFRIDANNVTLILNGHRITGGGGAQPAILTLGSGTSILGPGKLSGWTAGIALDGGSANVRGVTATGDGIAIVLESAGNDVRGNVMTGGGDGIVVAGTGNTVIGNFAHGNGTDLVDNNPNCDSNVWRATTSGRPCRPSPPASIEG